MATTTEDDDLSFPAITAVPSPHFIESPPLWRCLHHNDMNFVRSERNSEGKLKFCLVQELKPKSATSTQRRSYSYDDYEDERMDLLWEDNKDLSRNCVKLAESTRANASSSPGRAVQVRCIEALKLSRSNGHRFSGKKRKILVFIKILKKVLVHRNSRRSIKKQAL